MFTDHFGDSSQSSASLGLLSLPITVITEDEVDDMELSFDKGLCFLLKSNGSSSNSCILVDSCENSSSEGVETTPSTWSLFVKSIGSS